MEGVKVLITGGSGLLGREVMKQVKVRGGVAVGLAFSRVGEDLRRCNLMVPGEVESIIAEEKPSVIIHCAAQRAPNQVEENYEEACKLNVEASRRLATSAKLHSCKMIYISTDYVFDGTSPAYAIDDETNPLNKYGQSKLDGEKAAVSANLGVCILRIPVLYGNVEYLGESAVTCLLSLILSEEPKVVSHLERRYPAHTTDIAKILCDLVERVLKNSSLKGIFHWSGHEQMTKYQMVQTMAKVFNKNADHIKPDATVPTTGPRRPVDCRLDNSRLELLGIFHHTPFEIGIRECLERFVN